MQASLIGCPVIVSDPPSDNFLWQHSFEGIAKSCRKEGEELIYSVEDGDGDCWDVPSSLLDFNIFGDE